MREIPVTRFNCLVTLALLLLFSTLSWGSSLKKSSHARPGKSTARAVDSRDAEGNTPLMLAAQKGDCDVIARLVAEGADVNARNPRESTPVMFATDGGLAAVDLLLRHGAKVGLLRTDGLSALSFAVVRNRFRGR